MKEIENEINELKERLKKKEDELFRSGNLNAYKQGEINNRCRDIKWLESRFKDRERNPAHRNTVLKNFKEEANKIKNDIEKI
jgi:translation initiation factor 2B subunit (eIF-2B alpha/beta/delta family)